MNLRSRNALRLEWNETEFVQQRIYSRTKNERIGPKTDRGKRESESRRSIMEVDLRVNIDLKPKTTYEEKESRNQNETPVESELSQVREFQGKTPWVEWVLRHR